MKKRFGSDVATGRINPFVVSAEHITQTKYKPRLFGEFETSEDFLYTLEVLEVAEEGDVVELSISSLGGSASALSTLLHAMKKCRGYIRCVFTGSIASAGTFPLFYCDEFELAEDGEWMFHEASYGYGGTASNVSSYVDFAKEWNKRMLERTYLGFFNEQELEELMKGRQWYMFPEEVMERMDKRAEFLEKRMQEQEKQARKQAAQLKRALKSSEGIGST